MKKSCCAPARLRALCRMAFFAMLLACAALALGSRQPAWAAKPSAADADSESAEDGTSDEMPKAKAKAKPKASKSSGTAKSSADKTAKAKATPGKTAARKLQ